MDRPSYSELGNDLEATSLIRGETTMARDGTAPTAAVSIRSTGTRRAATLVGTALLLVFMLATTMTGTPVLLDSFDPSKTSAKFDKFDRYVMPDFDEKKPFASFLAGISGMWGMPAWSFYVNRGQGMAAFGTKDKNGGIQRYETAEKAYLNVPFNGFRTMIRGTRQGWFGSSAVRHQPFFPKSFSEGGMEDSTVSRDMAIGMNEMEITESNDGVGLDTNVLYFTVPNEEFPAMIRRVTFTNTGSGTLSLEVLDGLAQLYPFGPTIDQLDNMGRTTEAYYRVYNVEEGHPITEPFYHISQATTDVASVELITAGNYVTSFVEGGDGEHLGFIVDPTNVFGQDTTQTGPSEWFNKDSDFFEFMARPQGYTARTPCAFAGAQLQITQGESVSLVSVYGQAPDESARKEYINKVRAEGYVEQKRAEAHTLAHSITDNVKVSTGVALFDLYVAQDYLDNVLRGGLPHKFGVGPDAKIYHIFSRIHGDLERDYNNYLVEPTYFSQGPGNFRDVNQNRRVDLAFSPEVRDFNIRTFLSFCQFDGYNPLSVASPLFKVMDKAKATAIIHALGVSGDKADVVRGLLTAPFRPGSLIADLTTNGVSLPKDRDAFVTLLLSSSMQQPAAQFAQNGFWSDHWAYTLDLADNFVSVYPDEREWLMYDTEPLPSFIAPALVKTRTDRYQLVPDADCDVAESGDCVGVSTIVSPMAVSMWDDEGFSQARMDAINTVNARADHLTDVTNAGNTWHPDAKGDPVTATVLAKFAMLGIVKFSTMDPSGFGVEYEGGKPGWNDAMNGLPGLLGSGMPETYEMLRILQWCKAGVDDFGRSVDFPAEFGVFLEATLSVLDAYNAGTKDLKATFAYWDAQNNAREAYRTSIEGALSGRRAVVSATHMSKALGNMIDKVEAGVATAVALGNGISPTYFRYEAMFELLPVTEVTVPAQPSKVRATAFTRHALPMFLEGPVRHFKVFHDVDEKRKAYSLVRHSNMYDSAMQQYFVCESLRDMRQDLGRMKAFSPGWLENQSIWLHMSYKFYLELLRGGLYEEFFHEIKTGLVPFMDNAVYGRSPLEASSFIVSSAFPDKKMHGAGFQARLSGSTAEFMSMYLIMMQGQWPFGVDAHGALFLHFKPVIPDWLWKDDLSASFTFLSMVHVTYTVPTKTNSWTLGEANRTTLTYHGGATHHVSGGVIPSSHAKAVRAGQVATIDIHY